MIFISYIINIIQYIYITKVIFSISELSKQSTVGKRVNIELKEVIHTQAKVLAALKGSSLADYLADAIAAAVKKDKKLVEELMKNE